MSKTKEHGINSVPPVPEAKPEPQRVLLVYLGVKEMDDSKLYHRYRAVTRKQEGDDTIWENADMEEMLYGKRLFYGMPGSVFSIEWTPGKEGHSVKLGTDKGEGVWPDEDERVKWAAQSRAIQNAFESAKALDKLLTNNVALERLEPFRAAYKRSSANVKRQMLAEILRFITT